MTTPKVKITVSLSAETAERLRSTVADGTATSASAYVEHALRSQFAAEAEFDDLVAEMLRASGGAPTAAERAEAARTLGTDAA